MGTFFFTNPFLSGKDRFLTFAEPDDIPFFGPIAGRVERPPFFGPIAGPVDIPPLFGPIAGPVEIPLPPTQPRVTPEVTRRRRKMPFDIGPNLTGLVGSVLGGLFGARRQTAGFLPGSPQVILPPVEVLRQAPPIRAPITMPGRVVQGAGCQCTIQRQLPARVVNMRGTPVIDPATNQIIGCTPRRKRMNPMNGKAATRAARRLTSVMRFQRKIQKAVQRACRSKSGGGFRRSAAKKGCR